MQEQVHVDDGADRRKDDIGHEPLRWAVPAPLASPAKCQQSYVYADLLRRRHIMTGSVRIRLARRDRRDRFGVGASRIVHRVQVPTRGGIRAGAARYASVDETVRAARGSRLAVAAGNQRRGRPVVNPGWRVSGRGAVLARAGGFGLAA
jgi:hypothetical protein